MDERVDSARVTEVVHSYFLHPPTVLIPQNHRGTGVPVTPPIYTTESFPHYLTRRDYNVTT